MFIEYNVVKQHVLEKKKKSEGLNSSYLRLGHTFLISILTNSEIIEEYNFFVIINNVILSYVEGWGMQKKKKKYNWQEWLYE